MSREDEDGADPSDEAAPDTKTISAEVPHKQFKLLEQTKDDYGLTWKGLLFQGRWHVEQHEDKCCSSDE